MTTQKHILVTGGAGYIGSHMLVALHQAGFKTTVIDNFSNSSPISLQRVEKITDTKIPLYEIDLCNLPALQKVFKENHFDGVIHFAALKAVDTSVAKPLTYYRNNLVSTLNLCEVMEAHYVQTLIFSSSAAVYGEQTVVPITEKAAINPTNPYGYTKAMTEQILLDAAKANPKLHVTVLRYFNPIGAHPSGLIGEDPHGPPDNLVPYITQVASGKLPYLRIFGDDYPTPDGTGVRDYIHVMDLVEGHLAALERPAPAGKPAIYNLGTGQGYSVKEVLAAFEAQVGKPIPSKVLKRRVGDIATCYADPSEAEKHLHWRASRTLATMAADAWRWQSQNPHGY